MLATFPLLFLEKFRFVEAFRKFFVDRMEAVSKFIIHRLKFLEKKHYACSLTIQISWLLYGWLIFLFAHSLFLFLPLQSLLFNYFSIYMLIIIDSLNLSHTFNNLSRHNAWLIISYFFPFIHWMFFLFRSKWGKRTSRTWMNLNRVKCDKELYHQHEREMSAKKKWRGIGRKNKWLIDCNAKDAIHKSMLW